ncbi:MAG TPA: glutathione S-transferase family protein [Allosphingosinicella sp.]|jgi:glutathione S-transferase
MITVTAFKSVPPFAQGLVRDLRVRWALEEAGLRYAVKLLGDGDKDGADYRSWQPFGQVPAYEENGLRLFESGAIVLRIAERSETLLPGDPAARARAVEWLFAALNTIEPAIQTVAAIDLFFRGEEWAKLRRPSAEAAARKRLAELAAALGDKAYLDGPRFTAGDLMMATVLRILRHTDLVAEQPALADWLERCEERPAFRRALAGQMADFEPAAA